MAQQEEIRTVEPQRDPHLFDLVHEARNCPQVRDIRLIAVMGPELIVEVVLDAGARQVSITRLEVLVSAARPAVQ